MKTKKETPRNLSLLALLALGLTSASLLTACQTNGVALTPPPNSQMVITVETRPLQKPTIHTTQSTNKPANNPTQTASPKINTTGSSNTEKPKEKDNIANNSKPQTPNTPLTKTEKTEKISEDAAILKEEDKKKTTPKTKPSQQVPQKTKKPRESSLKLGKPIPQKTPQPEPSSPGDYFNTIYTATENQ
jgi:hypothetical protein